MKENNRDFASRLIDVNKLVSNLQKQLKAEQDKNARLNYHAETLQQDLTAEQQAHTALIEKLKTIKWVDTAPNSGYSMKCPACKGQYDGSRHSEDCWLDKAIRGES